MAESVRLKDGRYIDTEGVYDFEQKKTQKEINASLIDTSLSQVTCLVSGGTVDHNYLTKVGNVVNTGCRVYGNDFPASGDFFKITEGYRPRKPIIGIGYMIISSKNDIQVPILCEIDTNGLVSMKYSLTERASQIGFAITYSV